MVLVEGDEIERRVRHVREDRMKAIGCRLQTASDIRNRRPGFRGLGAQHSMQA